MAHGHGHHHGGAVHAEALARQVQRVGIRGPTLVKLIGQQGRAGAHVGPLAAHVASLEEGRLGGLHSAALSDCAAPDPSDSAAPGRCTQ